jgi:CMP-N,N'-diacetyllegionaminic acid synthase
LKPLVVIPARGGSKGIPRKNIKLLQGKPLIQYSIEEAQKIFSDEYIFISTDDREIKEVVEKSGLKIPILRPKELATDTSGTYEVLLHAINYYEKNKNYFPDVIVLLQPTSPFRNAKHIKEALNLFCSDCEMVVSVKETKSNPYYLLREENQDGWLVKSKDGNFTRRQDCPKVYELNGAIYVINVNSLKEKAPHEFTRVRKYEMDELSSHDIDSELDWKITEVLLDHLVNFRP